MSFETLIFEKRDGAAWLTLNRPDVLNAYNVRMRDELSEVLAALADDDESRVLAIQGAGRAFCAGADLTEFCTAPSPTEARRIRFARDVWQAFRSLNIPKVAILHGFVFGSGLEIALFCDLRIAAEGTLFGFPEVKLGMIPAAGGTQTLPRAIGSSRALDVLLTGRRFDAHVALRGGLLSKLVPAEQLANEAEAIVGHLANARPQAVRAVLRAVHDGADLPLQQALGLETRLAKGLAA
ncbi:MAG: enoyl-CoA hydratase/isomerase family protein [Chloroflexi bacterium]|nr:enoyl-CoA hydratase/isomerase family protein [Chloroflexota bacterium]